MLVFGLTCHAQVKLDSVFQVVDTIPTAQSKLWKLEGVARKNKLSNKEIKSEFKKINICVKYPYKL